MLFLFCLSANGQIGGRFAFESASLPNNARLTALGGTLISVKDDDIALAQMNPALLDTSMNNQLSINHNFIFAGISNSYVAFGKTMSNLGVTALASISSVNYGTFDLTDELGNINGDFSAGEIIVTLGAGKQLNERISAGVNLKFLTGHYESYASAGIGIDLGLYYQKSDTSGTWGIVLKNMGGELNAIADQKRSLPFDLQIAYSKRLQHLPFRFTITGHNLQKWYIRYDDPDIDNPQGLFETATPKSGFSKGLDNFFRHLIFSGEFLIGKREQLRMRFAYNHLRKQELKLSSFSSSSGFSLGFGFNIKKIQIDYGIGYYHLAGATNHLSLRLNMGRIFSKI